jgi:hypothetical protein
MENQVDSSAKSEGFQLVSRAKNKDLQLGARAKNEDKRRFSGVFREELKVIQEFVADPFVILSNFFH